MHRWKFLLVSLVLVTASTLYLNTTRTQSRQALNISNLQPNQPHISCDHKSPEELVVHHKKQILEMRQNTAAMEKSACSLDPQSEHCQYLKDLSLDLSRQVDQAKYLSTSAPKMSVTTSTPQFFDYFYNKKKFDENDCGEVWAHTPGPHDPQKFIRLRYHYMLKKNALSPGNFTKDHDGTGDPSMNGVKYAKEVVAHMNYKLQQNQIMNLAPDSTTTGAKPPALPFNFKFFIGNNEKDIHFHEVHEDFLNNNYFYNHGMNPNLNHIPTLSYSDAAFDTLMMQMKSADFKSGYPYTNESGQPLVWPNGKWIPAEFPHFRNFIGGRAFSIGGNSAEATAMYVFSPFQQYHIVSQDWAQLNPYQPQLRTKGMSTSSSFTNISLHEYGHNFGLGHAWQTRSNYVRTPNGSSMTVRCDDYPTGSQVEGWCSGDKSNNMMDYNCTQGALTPCQLSVVHYNLAHGQRKTLYMPCRHPMRNPSQHKEQVPFNVDTIIPQNVTTEWTGTHHLTGDLILRPGATLTINCHVTVPADAIIDDSAAGAKIYGKNKITRRQCVTPRPTFDHAVPVRNGSNPVIIQQRTPSRN